MILVLLSIFKIHISIFLDNEGSRTKTLNISKTSHRALCTALVTKYPPTYILICLNVFQIYPHRQPFVTLFPFLPTVMFFCIAFLSLCFSLTTFSIKFRIQFKLSTLSFDSFYIWFLTLAHTWVSLRLTFLFSLCRYE